VKLKKTAFCFLPKRVVRHTNAGIEMIGWVWLRRVELTRNLNYGWLHFEKEVKP
jgi:hypothetical protein